jgi:hypothetical protein
VAGHVALASSATSSVSESSPFTRTPTCCRFLTSAERDPALAQLAAAAVSGLAPAGPELRRRPVGVAFDGRPGAVISAPLTVREAGFSLHAAARAGAADEQGREARLMYILQPRFRPSGCCPGPRARAHRAEEAVQRRHRGGRLGPALTALPPRRFRPSRPR